MISPDIDRLLRDIERLRNKRDEAAGRLARQAEITRELDELYGGIRLAHALDGGLPATQLEAA